jgi:hypothetical protein
VTNEQVHECQRCGEHLNPATVVWLELNMESGLYHEDGMVPAEISQGCFPFGSACAASVLARGGRLQRIKKLAVETPAHREEK